MEIKAKNIRKSTKRIGNLFNVFGKNVCRRIFLYKDMTSRCLCDRSTIIGLLVTCNDYFSMMDTIIRTLF